METDGPCLYGQHWESRLVWRKTYLYEASNIFSCESQEGIVFTKDIQQVIMCDGKMHSKV